MKYSYEEVIDIIQNTRRFGKLTGYEVSKRMLEQLGNPHKDIPFVHIAGTNGKGSTTAFLCEILKQTGKKIGMFTSPHLVAFEERIRINGVYISKEDVTRLGNQLLETAFDVPPTMFDYCLCMAVLYFKEKNCDLMVMETGIGGRFDSTNALGTPLVSIITKIGFDHMAILGNTLEEIAYEKAGIIKKNVPVILQKQEESARKVIYDYVHRLNFENTNESKIDAISKNRNSGNASQFIEKGNEKYKEHKTQKEVERLHSMKSKDRMSRYVIEVSQPVRDYVATLPMKMLGNFQIENAATAVLAAVYILGNGQSNERDFTKQKEFAAAESTGIIENTSTTENANITQNISTIENARITQDVGRTESASITQDASATENANITQDAGIIENINIKESIKQNNAEIINRKDLPQELCMLPICCLEYIYRGIAQAVWKGRMELINENPFFIIDGAHNPDGVHALAESLKTLYPNEKFHFIMAVMADKDYENMIEELIPLAYDFVTVTPEYSRALQAKELAECIAKKGIEAVYAQKLEDVIVPLLPAKDSIKDTEVLNINSRGSEKTIAFGSLYFIGEIEALLQ